MRVWGLVLLGVVVNALALYLLITLKWTGLAIDVGLYAAFGGTISVVLGQD